MIEAFKNLLVQQFVTKLSVEALNEPILLRFPWRNVMPCHMRPVLPLENGA